MSSITGNASGQAIIRELIEGDGIYQDDDQVTHIVNYQNIFNGSDTFKLCYSKNDFENFKHTGVFRSWQLVWQHSSVKPKKMSMEVAMLASLNGETLNTADGCMVEDDGTCPHGLPSPLIEYGVM